MNRGPRCHGVRRLTPGDGSGSEGVREVGVILTLPRRREDGEFTEDPLRSGAAGRVLSRPQQVLCPGQRCRQAGKTGQAYQTVQEGPNSSQGVYFWRDVRL